MFRPCTVTEAGLYTSSFPGSPIREGYYLARDYEVRKYTEKLKPITSSNFTGTCDGEKSLRKFLRSDI